MSHAAHPCDASLRISFQVARVARGLTLRYALTGDLSNICLPPDDGGARRDELWKQTCFEVFLRAGNADSYLEFNFAANGDWAAYQFESYRAGGSDLTCDPLDIATTRSPDKVALVAHLATLPSEFEAGQIRLGPAAILQTNDDTRSYWALYHLGERPDFHRPETFQINLD
ncbi:MAG: DOMON-like domain-containing protein [Pseudomonadota bacterium]